MSGEPQSLPELCTEAFAFALQLSQAADPGDGDALRRRINGFLEQIQAGAQARGLTPGAVDTAKYALVALFDEIVLTSSWALKGAWLGRPLQMEHWGSFAAGEEFFARLDAVRGTNDPRRAEVMEVFLLSLCMGFKGKYGTVAGMETLKKLKAELAQELRAAPKVAAPSQSVGVSARDQAIGRARRKTDAGDLSPAWHAPKQALTDLPRDLPVRAVVVACLAALLALFVVLATILGSGTDAAIEGLAR